MTVHPPFPTEMPALEGYRDLVEIGSGGFGTVYRAHRQAFDQVVAIKITRGPVDDGTRLRFDRERRSMGLLAQHPHIVTVYDAGVSADGALFLVMEYLPRGSYGPRVGQVPTAEVLDVGVRMSGALATAHRAGVLHRDVKPENILISPYGEPLLADFGIARMSGARRTATGIITASLHYGAPEVLCGREPGPSSDLYCLAGSMFALLAGAPAFSREDDSPGALIPRVLREPVPDLRPRGVPPALCAAIERAMAKDPAHRHHDVLEFARELVGVQRASYLRPSTPVVDGEAVRTVLRGNAPPAVPLPRAAGDGTFRPPQAVRRDPVAPAPVATREPTSRAGGAGPGRRTVTLVALAAVLTVAALVAALVVVARPGGSGDDPAPPAPEAAAGTVVGKPIRVGATPHAIVAANGRFWTANFGDGTVSEIDPTSGTARSIVVGGQPNGLAVSGTNLWVWNADDALVRVDTATGVVGPVAMAARPRISDIVSSGDTIWLSHRDDDVVTRIDGATGRPRGAPIRVGPAPIPLAVGADRLYAVNSGDSTVSKIDLRSGEVLDPPIPLPCGGGAAADSGTVYVGCETESSLQTIDERTGATGPHLPLPGAGTFALHDGELWVAFPFDDTLVRYDMSTRTRRGGAIHGAGRGTYGLAVAGDGTLWTINVDRNEVVRVRPT